MIWLIDFTGWTMANAVPIKTAREVVNILQNHYPERLAIAFLFNPPKVFETFWKVKSVVFPNVIYVYGYALWELLGDWIFRSF